MTHTKSCNKKTKHKNPTCIKLIQGSKDWKSQMINKTLIITCLNPPEYASKRPTEKGYTTKHNRYWRKGPRRWEGNKNNPKLNGQGAYHSKVDGGPKWVVRAHWVFAAKGLSKGCQIQHQSSRWCKGRWRSSAMSCDPLKSLRILERATWISSDPTRSIRSDTCGFLDAKRML